MAVITKLVCDIEDGCKNSDVETIVFGWRGNSYEIDACSKHAEHLNTTMEEYTEAGRRVASTPRAAATRRLLSSSGGGSGRTPEELAAVRAWANEQGYEVAERGRIKKEILDAYDAATK